MDETRYLPQNWVFNGRFSFKVWQHGQKQLCLQYEVCWVLYKMVGAPSFLYIKPTLQSPPNKRSSISVNFNIPIPPLLFHKIILTAPTNTPFLYASAIFYLLLFAYYDPNNLHRKYFPYLNHFANSGCIKGLGS